MSEELTTTLLKLSLEFGMEQKKKRKEEKVSYNKTKLPCKNVSEQDIREFFELLTFAVNQPSVDDLVELVNGELNKDFNLSQIDVMFNYIQAEMLKWFKDPQSVGYSKSEANKMMLCVSSQIHEIQLIGFSLKEKEWFELEGITFEPNNILRSRLNFFLDSVEDNLLILQGESTSLVGMKLNQILVDLL